MLHAACESKNRSTARQTGSMSRAGKELQPPFSSDARPHHEWARLQRTHGNQAVLLMLSRSMPTVQTKLTVNQPGDAFEQEANRVADQVMRMPEPVGIQRKCSSCADEEKKTELHRKKTGAGPQFAPPSVQQVLNSPGQLLDPATRAFMEPRFGRDFSAVRIHTGTTDAESARSVAAMAFTVGQDIVFGTGHYTPGTSSGKKLLAHELAHVVQQSRSESAPTQESNLEMTRLASLSSSPAVAVSEAAEVGIARQTNPPGQDPALPTASYSQWKPITPSLGIHLSAEDIKRINDFLFDHKFAVDGVNPLPLLDGFPVPLDAIIDKVYALVLPIIPRFEVADLVRARWAQMTNNPQLPSMIPALGAHSTENMQIPRLEDLYTPPHIPLPELPLNSSQAGEVLEALHIAGPPDALKAVEDGKKRVHQRLGAAGAGFTWHVARGAPASPGKDVAMQFTVADNTLFHDKDNPSGVEVQRQIQFSYNLVTGAIQITEGVQASLILAFFDGLVQLSAFGQVLAGVARSGAPNGGTAVLVQPSVGAQFAIQLGRVQLGAMASVGTTGQPGARSTPDFGLTPGVQLTF